MKPTSQCFWPKTSQLATPATGFMFLVPAVGSDSKVFKNVIFLVTA